MASDSKAKREFTKAQTGNGPQGTSRKRIVLVRREPALPKFKRSPKVDAKPTGIARPYSDADGYAACVLCHRMVHESKMHEHLLVEHRLSKKEIKAIDLETKSKGQYVRVVQGGLPGLGKRSR